MSTQGAYKEEPHSNHNHPEGLAVQAKTIHRGGANPYILRPKSQYSNAVDKASSGGQANTTERDFIKNYNSFNNYICDLLSLSVATCPPGFYKN